MASARGDSSVGGQGDTRTGVDEPADVSPSILHNRDNSYSDAIAATPRQPPTNAPLWINTQLCTNA